jgi:dolichol-phosphate mannosyltransferase
MKKRISIVVPVYKEEKNIPLFLARMQTVVTGRAWDYEILFALDPSPDRTYEVIKEYMGRDPNIGLLYMSRRFGQPAATIAGLLNCSGDACVVIDVDLQDPPELIAQMVEKWQEGFDVVYAQRRSRKGETVVKKIVAHVGYSVINTLADIEIPRNVGDFRLMDRKVIEELRKLKEQHGFLRGLVAFIGYRQTAIQYDRDERAAGVGNYNRYLGSLKIGLNGLICFSSRPLQLISMFGVLVAFLGFAMGLWYFIQKAILGYDLTPGLSTTVIVVTFFSGVQLLSLGVVGEYIGRIYDEVKQRPMYIIAEKSAPVDPHGHE